MIWLHVWDVNATEWFTNEFGSWNCFAIKKIHQIMTCYNFSFEFSWIWRQVSRSVQVSPGAWSSRGAKLRLELLFSLQGGCRGQDLVLSPQQSHPTCGGAELSLVCGEIIPFQSSVLTSASSNSHISLVSAQIPHLRGDLWHKYCSVLGVLEDFYSLVCSNCTKSCLCLLFLHF